MGKRRRSSPASGPGEGRQSSSEADGAGDATTKRIRRRVKPPPPQPPSSSSSTPSSPSWPLSRPSSSTSLTSLSYPSSVASALERGREGGGRSGTGRARSQRSHGRKSGRGRSSSSDRDRRGRHRRRHHNDNPADSGDSASSSPSPLPSDAVYWALGSDKWREAIDLHEARGGPMIYDNGHDSQLPEPGFLASITRAQAFVATTLGQKTDINMYMTAHRLACDHFGGWRKLGTAPRAAAGTLRSPTGEEQEGTGTLKFVTPAAIREMRSVRPRYIRLQYTHPKNRELRAKALPASTTMSSAEYSSDSESGLTIHCLPMKRQRRRHYFNHFAREMYARLEAAEVAGDGDPAAVLAAKVRALGMFHQAVQRLHVSEDGTQRTAMLFLNKHLVEIGLHPVLLHRPHNADIFSTADWLVAIKMGLATWRQRAAKIAAVEGNTALDADALRKAALGVAGLDGDEVDRTVAQAEERGRNLVPAGTRERNEKKKKKKKKSKSDKGRSHSRRRGNGSGGSRSRRGGERGAARTRKGRRRQGRRRWSGRGTGPSLADLLNQLPTVELTAAEEARVDHFPSEYTRRYHSAGSSSSSSSSSSTSS